MSVVPFAPMSMADFAKAVDREVDGAIWPYIAREPYTAAQLTAALAAQFPYMKAIVSNGTGNRLEAMSNGTAFYYLDGTAV